MNAGLASGFRHKLCADRVVCLFNEITVSKNKPKQKQTAVRFWQVIKNFVGVVDCNIRLYSKHAYSHRIRLMMICSSILNVLFL